MWFEHTNITLIVLHLNLKIIITLYYLRKKERILRYIIRCLGESLQLFMIITLYKFHQIKLKSHSIPFTFIKQKKKKAEEQSAREHAEKGTASAFVLLFNSNNRRTEKILCIRLNIFYIDRDLSLHSGKLLFCSIPRERKFELLGA